MCTPALNYSQTFRKRPLKMSSQGSRLWDLGLGQG